MIKGKTIALIAHDARKADMVDWVKYNTLVLAKNNLVCTGTTGRLVKSAMVEQLKTSFAESEPKIINMTDSFVESLIELECKESGPMGGDAQIAAMVVEGKIDMCIFLIDDLSANPHEADIQMLLRQCRIHNIPVACNRYTADLMITSDLWDGEYKPTEPTYTSFDRNGTED